MPFAPGQSWTYRAPEGFEASRIVIGAIVSFADSPPIVCCSVIGAPRRLPDGSTDSVTIPFLPLSEPAFQETVVANEGTVTLDETFAHAFDEWRNDDRGMSSFTVPFEGYLDRMIALQMAAIVGETTT